MIQPKRDSFSNKVVNLYSKLLGWVWVRLKFKSQITSFSIPELHDIMQFLHVTSIMIHAFLTCVSMNIALVPVFFGIYVMGLDGHCIHRYIIIHCQMISSAFSQTWGQWWGKLSSNVGRNLTFLRFKLIGRWMVLIFHILIQFLLKWTLFDGCLWILTLVLHVWKNQPSSNNF